MKLPVRAIKPEELWKDFCRFLSLHLQTASNAALAAAWAAKPNRTLFYRKNLLIKVAESLGYDFSTELFKVDFAMWVKDTDPKVPVVFVESENAASTAHHEVSKLTCISAPLRVLIVPVQWDEAPGVWPGGGMRKRLLDHWQKIITTYASVWPRSGLFGLIVGEWQTNGVLRFYANAINAEADLVRPTDEVLFERAMTLNEAARAKAESDARQQDRPSSLRDALPKRTILIAIGNDSALLSETTETCRDEGHSVIQAQSNAEAIEQMQRAEIHVLVYRWRDGGWEVIQWCRNHHPSASIILFVDKSEREQAVESIKAGVFDYLEIPFEWEEFQRQMTAAIDGQRSKERFFGNQPR